MANRTINWCTAEKLTCTVSATTVGYLCVPAALVSPTPSTSNGYVEATITGVRNSTSSDYCGLCKYVYTITYDDSQLISGAALTVHDIYEVLCEDCIVNFIVDRTSGTSESFCWVPVTNEAGLIIVNDAGNAGAIITDNITLTADLEIEVPLQFTPCGILSTDGNTLTINNSIEAGFYQIFDTTSDELVFGAGSNPQLYPQWFGATGDGATDDTSALQTAINIAGNSNIQGELFIPPGTYLNTGLMLPSSVSLKGAGVRATILMYSPVTGDALSLQSTGVNNSYNTISDLKIEAATVSTGSGITGAVDPLYVADIDIHNYEIEGFLKGIYLPYGLQVRIGFGRLLGQGKAVAGGAGLQLGDRTLGTPRLVNTAEISGVYANGYETSFVLDGSIHDVHGVTSESCDVAFLIGTRCFISGSWIQADTYLFETRAGGWPIGAYNNLFYNGLSVEQDNLIPMCNLTDPNEVSVFQKSEFLGTGIFRMRYATSAARSFQFGDVTPAYLYNASGTIRAEAVTRPLEVNRDAAGVELTLFNLLQEGVLRGSIAVNAAPGTGATLRNASGLTCLEWDANRSVTAGEGLINTTAVNGFLYVPTCSGTPTGVPTVKTGFSPIIVDTSNNKLYFYSGGAWRDAGP